MDHVVIDFAQKLGAVKPMHAVNNGPVYKFSADQRITNLPAYKEAGIPYARTHDAAFNATYGGEHTVDIIAIFPNFDADPDDPASYDFRLTDDYMRVIELAGTKPFFRLGNKIEHWPKKYGTLPPKDFHKWAVICEHVIRHYTEGWADGFHMDMPYWEIWNEPDLDRDDSDHKRCWGGTAAEFYEFFNIAATHLKKCFPHLKIGGPACCGLNEKWINGLLEKLTAPIDFFSWHVYAREPETVASMTLQARRILDEHGLQHVESILNEWNYVRGWENDDWVYSLKAEKSLKGASFIAATMETCQYLPLDMLMYYDARPCAMNGMFATDYVCDLLKGYYPFRMFNELYKLDHAVGVESDQPRVYACAAASDAKAAAMVTYYTDDDSAEAEREVKLTFKNAAGQNGLRLTFRLLDETHNDEIVKEELVSSDEFSVYLKLPRLGTYLVEAAPL